MGCSRSTPLSTHRYAPHLRCLVLTFARCCQGDCRLKLNSFLNSISDLIPKPQIERLASTMSKESNRKDLQQDQTTVFDYFPDDVSMEWEHWRTKVAEWTNPADATQITTGSLLVPTFESCRFEWIARTLTSNKTNILVTGPSASTKSSNIRMFVRSLDQYKFTSTTVSFTSASTPKFLVASQCVRSVMSNIYQVGAAIRWSGSDQWWRKNRPRPLRLREGRLVCSSWRTSAMRRRMPMGTKYGPIPRLLVHASLSFLEPSILVFVGESSVLCCQSSLQE